MNTTEPAQPLGLVSSAQLGQDDTERAAFEAWFGAPARGLDRLGDGYALSSAHAAWKAWLAGGADGRRFCNKAIAEISVHIVRLGVPAFGTVIEGIDKLLAAERERCAMKLQVTRPDVQLAAGELSADEWRICASVLRWMQGRIRGA